ncbi:LLM class flavin-dependent oxidoreductase [Rhodococcus sp. NPDC059968]|uniref:LLM class flavin-dependent oxidoreductase n=1 Tax=Rhodococcus sp. NPDC059968 TaxID=3347017 RepID=UPI0036729FF4
MTTLVLGVEIPDDQLAHAVGNGFDRVPELLDEAGIGYVVLGADRGTYAAASVSPLLVGTVFARRTYGLGIVAAASPQRDHPYNIARRTASLDHISGGRAGWLAIRSDQSIVLGAPEHGTWAEPTALPGASLLADATAAVRALWRTWPIESLTLDAPSPRPPQAEVRYADHAGVFATTGPLNVPTTPQGEPVVFWNYRTGESEAAGVADVAVVTASDHASAATELPATVTAHVRVDGRQPDLLSLVKELAAAPAAVSGVLVRVDIADLHNFVEHILPELVGTDLVRTRTTRQTLREYLDITRRSELEPQRLRPVFAPV